MHTNPVFFLLLLLTGVSWLIQRRLRSKFEHYAQLSLRSGLSGREIAARMLADHNIRDVQITSTEGQLTDNYNPTTKTVNLSADVYNGRSATAAAVAAHECGHAVQHADAYSFLQLRSALVPALSSVSRFMPMLLLAGIFLLRVSLLPLGLAVGVFALATLFSFITLPVEFDASRRALAWMDRSLVVTADEHAVAKDALWWAAMTYVVAAISSLATLLYYGMILLGGNRRN
ncbi:MAG: zinc metallopeptidase [Janthinobacterium lividum]